MSTEFFNNELLKDMLEQRRRLEVRGAELADYYPAVSFYLPGVGISRRNYCPFLLSLLLEFVEQADPRNKGKAEQMRYNLLTRPNEEGGIGSITIDGIFIAHCKMYFFDGTQESVSYNPEGKYKPWRGLTFRDHPDPNPQWQTAKVFTITDALEKFLRSKKIKFTRVNRKK